MEHANQLAIRFLESLGYRVGPISESSNSGKRADIAAEGGDDRYIVEVKHRFEDPAQRATRNERLANGELVVTSESLGYSDRVDAIMRHGLKQIKQTPKIAGTFNLLWFHAEGMDADLKALRARNTFYGLVHLSPRPLEPPNARAIQCFYFDHNTSIRLPTVHGLVVVEGKSLQLCINEFAEDADEFRKSSLVAKLGNAVIDPAHFESAGEAIVLRSRVRRSDESLVLQEIHKLTSTCYVPIRLQRHAVSAAVIPKRRHNQPLEGSG